ncbi:MAG: hypothetical protein J3R72DRAFT_156227 [Linnemannia gamsii]|nr:MAG: hypothetical protein J3R72DRAFT_156227 [Linnemannia gamsii]
MRQQDALNLPEIRHLIGHHLTRDSLCACVRVNKDWHASFTPFLWSTFYFGHEKYTYPPLQPPSSAAIQQHAHLIKTFIISTLGTPFHLDLFQHTPLTQLQALYFCDYNRITCLDPNPTVAWIFQQNPKLRVVDYDGRHSKPYFNSLSSPRQLGRDLRFLLSSCPALTDLTIRCVEFGEDHLEPFRQLCAARLQRVSFHDTLFSIDIDWNTAAISMPHLQELCMTTTETATAFPGVCFILQCPNLRTLRWSTPVKPDLACLKSIAEACPRLQAIELQHMVLKDDVIATFLDSIKCTATEVIIRGIKFVSVENVLSFGLRAFNSLQRRHFSTLVVFDVGARGSLVESGSLLQMLYSCPNLRELTASRIWAEDIYDGQQQQQQGNWACRGLEVFKVKISISFSPLASSIHDAVFSQFAILPNLRVLHIGGGIRYTYQCIEEERAQRPTHYLRSIKEGGGLSLRLEYGLGHLSGLTKLESVSVGGFAQELKREEVDWMKHWWTELKELEGELHPRMNVSEAIRWGLTNLGVDLRQSLDRLGFV